MSLEIRPLAALYPPPPHIFLLDWYSRKGRKCRRHEHTAPATTDMTAAQGSNLKSYRNFFQVHYAQVLRGFLEIFLRATLCFPLIWLRFDLDSGIKTKTLNLAFYFIYFERYMFLIPLTISKSVKISLETYIMRQIWVFKGDIFPKWHEVTW